MEDIKGHLVLLVAPSGSGKRTVMSGLGDLADKIYFLPTYTSREKRQGAMENPNYRFISRSEFEQKVEKDGFIEWAEYSGNLYGTPKDEMFKALQDRKMVFKEMDLQGVEQIKQLIPSNHLTTIYIDAGSWEELKRRIVGRAAISETELELRKRHFLEESKFKEQADVVIDNTDGNLKAAQQHFREIIKGVLEKIS